MPQSTASLARHEIPTTLPSHFRPSTPAAPAACIDRTLSNREAEVLCWISEGKSDGDIASILRISRKTANYHVENAKRKLGALTRLSAVVIALRRGLIALALALPVGACNGDFGILISMPLP